MQLIPTEIFQGVSVGDIQKPKEMGNSGQDIDNDAPSGAVSLWNLLQEPEAYIMLSKIGISSLGGCECVCSRICLENGGMRTPRYLMRGCSQHKIRLPWEQQQH